MRRPVGDTSWGQVHLQPFVLVDQIFHPVMKFLIFQQSLARSSQNTNFSLVLQAGNITSLVSLREDRDETVELGLSGDLEKVNKKFLRLRLHPRVESKPLQY